MLKEIETKNLKYITFDIFENLDFINCKVSTRHGGLSKGVYGEMNLSFTIGDDTDSVYDNYKMFSKDLGFNFDNIQRGYQVHGTDYAVVTEDNFEKFSSVPQFSDTDMLLTNLEDVPLVTLFADCVPLFLVDKKNKAICVAHAGWRGTVNEIATKAVMAMRDTYGTEKDDLLVGIGPSIHSCCFLVNDDVYEEFHKYPDYRQFIKPVNNQYSIDLQNVNKYNLIKTGLVDEHNIEINEYCTSCEDVLLFSHRRQNRERGSLAGFLSITK